MTNDAQLFTYHMSRRGLLTASGAVGVGLLAGPVLGGATPAEIYYGITPACNTSVRPARAYENRSDDKLFEIAYLDPEQFLPVLIPKAA